MVRFIEGFDWSQTIADYAMKWTSQSMSSIGAGRLGGYCAELVATNKGFYQTIDAQSTWVVGVAFMCTNVTTGGRIISLYDTSTLHIRIGFNAGALYIDRSTTNLAVSANTISQDTWYYLEAKVTIGDAGVGNYEVRINGSSVGWLPSTGADTRNAGNASANIIRFGQTAAGSDGMIGKYDDLYIADGTAGINDFLGDTRIQTVLPGADGTHTDFTASAGSDFECVNELYDGDTTYLYSSTAGHMNTFNMDDIVAGYTIKGLGINGIMRKTDAGARTMRTFYEDSAGTHRNGATQSVGTSYVNYQQLVEVDPVTTSAFDVTGVNAIRPGVEIVA